MKTCFSVETRIKQFGNPSERFFHGPPLCLNLKNKTASHPTPPHPQTDQKLFKIYVN